jgi:hypothetical protein
MKMFSLLFKILHHALSSEVWMQLRMRNVEVVQIVSEEEYTGSGQFICAGSTD